MNLPDVLLEKVRIFFMAKGHPREGNQFGFIFGIGVMNQMQHMRHGITNDLAFGPTE